MIKLPYKVREDLIKLVEERADDLYEGCQNDADYPPELGDYLRDAVMDAVRKIGVKVDYDFHCKCREPEQVTEVVNHSMMWHDGDVICVTCGGYVRSYDAG
jgi:hypothetical protein